MSQGQSFRVTSRMETFDTCTPALARETTAQRHAFPSFHLLGDMNYDVFCLENTAVEDLEVR